MSYTPYYPGGWKDWPDVSTPITSAALTHIEAGFSGSGTGSGEDTLNVIAASGASQTLDISVGATQDVTLTANCTLAFANPPAGTGAWYMTILLRQDSTGSRTVTWPALTWIGTGLAPVLQTAASSMDSVVVFTDDDGATWFGVAQTSASGLKAGTSFPGSPSDGDLFYKTDVRVLFEYNSTVSRWLSLDRKYVPCSGSRVLNGAANVTGIIGFWPLFEDLYVESWVTMARTGATNNGSNFSTATLTKQSPAQVSTTVTSFTTGADATATNVIHNVSVASLFAAASFPVLYVNVTATGSPTNSDFTSYLICRSAG